MFVPKSFKIRQKTLEFLTQKRRIQLTQKLPNIQGHATLEEISNAIKYEKDLVSTQLDLLWHKKMVHDDYDKELDITKFIVLAEGMSKAASMEYINEGRQMNLDMFNKGVTFFAQTIIGITTIATLLYNITTISKIESTMQEVKKEVVSQKELLGKSKTDAQTQYNYFGQTPNH